MAISDSDLPMKTKLAAPISNLYPLRLETFSESPRLCPGTELQDSHHWAALNPKDLKSSGADQKSTGNSGD